MIAQVTKLSDARRWRRRLDALSVEDRRILWVAAASKGLTIYQYVDDLMRRKKTTLQKHLVSLRIIVRHPEVRRILNARIAARANG